MGDINEEEDVRCTFCGRTTKESGGIPIIGCKNEEGMHYICYECSMYAKTIFEGMMDEWDDEEDESLVILSPGEIYERLSDQVISQDEAKKRLAVAAYNHYKRISDASGKIRKSNILLLGPSGCGKTLLAKTLAKTLDVPFVIADATSYTEKGYVGNDVETILTQLLISADGNIRAAEHGIVYIDEIDKIARRQAGTMVRDPAGEGVQQALLKMVEGCTMTIPTSLGHRQMGTQYIQFNTDNVLFICGGAFEGLHDKKNEHSSGPIGFVSCDETEDYSGKNRLYEEIIEYGIIPEFLGRLPVVVELDELYEEELIDIMVGTKDPLIEEYETLLQADGVSIDYTYEALFEIAAEAIRRGTGARGLRSILEEVLLDVMFNAPLYSGESYFISEDYVRMKLGNEPPALDPDLEPLCFMQ